jgi:hypothetical protein
LTGDSPDELIKKITESARVITVRSSWRPKRFLFFERGNDARIIEYVSFSIQSGEPGSVRKQLRQRDVFLAGLSKLRPKFRDAAFNLDLVLLQNMQNACAADPLRGRPNQDKRIGRPRMFAARIFKSALKVDDRFPVLPDRNPGAELAEFLKILFKQRGDALTKFARIQLPRESKVGKPRCGVQDSPATSLESTFANKIVNR